LIRKCNHEGTKIRRRTKKTTTLNAETAEHAELNTRQRPAQPAALETSDASETQTTHHRDVCVSEALLVSWPASRAVA